MFTDKVISKVSMRDGIRVYMLKSSIVPSQEMIERIEAGVDAQLL